MKRVIIASKSDDFIYVILRNGDPIAKGSYDAIYKKANNMSIPVDIKKFSKSKFNSYFKMAKEARRPNPLKFAVNRYINDNREEYHELNTPNKIDDDFIYDVATRLIEFMRDYDWFDFMDSLDTGETEEDAIAAMAVSLSNKETVGNISDALSDMLFDEPDIDKDTVKGLINDLFKLR